MSSGYYDPHPTLALERPLALVAHPGAGVAHVARAISGRTGLPFNDVSRNAEAIAGASRARLQIESGVSVVREFEARALTAALQRQPFGVIAFESTLLESEVCFDQAQRLARTVHVRRPWPELLRRISAQCEAAPGSLPAFAMGAPSDPDALRDHLAAADARLALIETIFDAADEHASLVAEKLLASLDRLVGVERFRP